MNVTDVYYMSKTRKSNRNRQRSRTRSRSRTKTPINMTKEQANIWYLAKAFKKYLKVELKEIKLRKIIRNVIKEEIKNVSK